MTGMAGHSPLIGFANTCESGIILLVDMGNGMTWRRLVKGDQRKYVWIQNGLSKGCKKPKNTSKSSPCIKVDRGKGWDLSRTTPPQFYVVIARLTVAFVRLRAKLLHFEESLDARGQIQSIKSDVPSSFSKHFPSQMLQRRQGIVDARVHEDEDRTVRGSHDDFCVGLADGVENHTAGGLIADERGRQRVVGLVNQTPHAHGAISAHGGHVIPSWMKSSVEHGEGLQPTADFLGGEGRGAGIDGPEDAEDGGVHDGPNEQQAVVAAGEHEGSIGGKSAHVNVILVAMIFAENGALAVVDADVVDVPRHDSRVARTRDQPGVGRPSAHWGATRRLWIKGRGTEMLA